MTNGPITPLPGKAANKAFEMQGWNAKRAGFKESDCPYYSTSAAEKYWLKGFRS